MAIIYTFHENVSTFAPVKPSRKKQNINLNIKRVVADFHYCEQ